MCQLRGLRVLQQQRYQIYLHLLNLFYLIASLRSSDPAPCTIHPATLHRSLTSSKVPHQAQWSLDAISLAHSELTCAPMLRRSSRGTVRCGVVCKIKTVDYLAICLFYLFLLVLLRCSHLFFSCESFNNFFSLNLFNRNGAVREEVIESDDEIDRVIARAAIQR